MRIFKQKRFRNRLFGLSFLALLTTGFLSFRVQPNGDVFVVGTISDNDGRCSPGPQSGCTLRQALASAQNDDMIIFDTALNGQTITLQTGPLIINKNLTIEAQDVAGIAIDGNKKSTVMLVERGVVASIYALTIQNGNSDLIGGGLINDGTLTLYNSQLINNTAKTVGGALANNGTLNIYDSLIAHNAAPNAGGILNTGSLLMVNNTLTDNIALTYGHNAGLLNVGRLTITNSTVAYNQNGSGITNYGRFYLGSSFVGLNAINVRMGGYVDNPMPDISGEVISLGFNWIGNGAGANGITSGKYDYVGKAQVTIDPKIDRELLPDSGDTVLALASDSPLVGKGFCNWPDLAAVNPMLENVTVDARGLARKSPCDIGAFETPQIVMTIPQASQDANGSAVNPNPIYVMTVDDNSTNYHLQMTGGSGPYTVTLTSGSLPAGLMLSSDGCFSGIFMAPGLYTFTLTVTDANHRTDFQQFRIRVNALQGSTLLVTTDADPGLPNCADPTNCSLRTLIDSASADDTITFAPRLTQRLIKLNGTPLSINTALTVDGSKAPGVVIDGDYITPIVFSVGNTEATLQNLIIRHASCATVNFGDGPIEFVGGGIVNNGTLTVNRSVITDNSDICGDGGGIYNDGFMTVNDSLITHNIANSCSGVVNGNNHTDDMAPPPPERTMIIRNSTFFDNASGVGGPSQTCDILNGKQGTLTLLNSTVFSASGIGICNYGVFNIGSSLVARSSPRQVTGYCREATADIVGKINSLGYNLIGDGTNATGFVDGQNHDQVGTLTKPLDPKLYILRNNGGLSWTLALQPDSPAIGRGNCVDRSAANPLLLSILTDQRGVWRKTPCDIGAFETGLSPAF